MKDYIENTLGPRIQGDGGWVEYVSQEGRNLTLIFRGECSKCHMLDRCVAWMEEKIQSDRDESIHIVPVRKKPFFWDQA